MRGAWLRSIPAAAGQTQKHASPKYERMATYADGHAVLAQGGAGGDAVSMGFGCAREDTSAVMALFSEVIRSPALAQPKLDLLRAQV